MRGENCIKFVKRKHRVRTDADLLALMAQQARILDAIDRTRRARRVTQAVFALAAGISVQTYITAMSGRALVRTSTIAKLKRAQRMAATGALS
jgi:hypothetical protein